MRYGTICILLQIVTSVLTILQPLAQLVGVSTDFAPFLLPVS